MKLGVFSDSHGNLDYLETAASYAIHKGSADILVHLGDNYDDAKTLKQFGRRVIQVPGVFSPYYTNPSIANRILETVGSWNILLSHTHEKHPNDLPSDLDPEELSRSRLVQMVLHGHTHKPRIEKRGGVWYVNPGHLRRKDKRGHPPSFAIIELTDNHAEVVITDLINGSELLRKKIDAG